MLTPVRHRHPFDSPRWTEADARSVLKELARSGQSVRQFAERHGLDPQRVYVWRRRVAGGDRTTFREVVVRAPQGGSTEAQGSALELTLASGVRIRVPPSFDAEALTRLLEVLERAHAC
jgi:transposase-like protein